MTLTPGTRLGPYEISMPIGAGGMGEVYAATDVNHEQGIIHRDLKPANVKVRLTAGSRCSTSDSLIDRLPARLGSARLEIDEALTELSRPGSDDRSTASTGSRIRRTFAIATSCSRDRSASTALSADTTSLQTVSAFSWCARSSSHGRFTQMVLVQNWFQELKAKAPAK